MNNLLAVVYLALGAAVYLLILVRMDRSRRHKPAAAAVVVWCFLLGLLSLPLAILFYALNVPGIVAALAFSRSVFVYQVMVVGLSEELAKMVAFIVIAYAFRQIHEPRDAMLQAAAVALGFSIVENYGYYQNWGLPVVWIRLIFSTPGHMLYGAIWGSAIAKAMFRMPEEQNDHPYRVVFGALAAAALVHGLFNTLLKHGYPDLAIAADIGAAIAAFALLKQLGDQSPYRNFDLRRYREAIPALRRGLSAQPGNPALRRRIAVYYTYAGEYDRAAYHLTEALKVQPRSLMLRFYRGVARFLAGRREAGSKEMRAAYGKMSDATKQVARRNLGKIVPEKRMREAALEAVNGEPVPGIRVL